MSNQLKPSTVYILVPFKDEKPTANWWYWVWVNGIPERRSVFFYGATNGWYNDNDCLKPFYKPVTHWLKEQSLYIFTKEELEKIINDAWEAGHKPFVNKPKLSYVKQLLP